MANQYTVIVTSTQASDLRTHKVAQNSGDKGRALRIKAKAGETYQLVEMQAGQAHSYAPQNVKVKRVGNDLVITFEGGSRPDIVIEGYYDVMAKDHKGLIGEAEDGNLYEYIPEDPHPLGLVQMLPEGGQDVAMALGAGEIIAPAAAAIAAFPLLGLLGLGAAGAAAYVLNKDDNTTPTNGISGKLSDTSDLTDGGNKNDDITRDNTPTLTGTAPVGSTATVTINGQTYPVTVNPDGTWTFQQPTNLPDGTYYPILNVTQNGVTTKSNLTPFTIDTTPPSIAITSNAAALASGETATVTFTLSEAVADFAQGDVAVTGGTLSNFQQDPNNPLVYTATFTPASTGTSATISVANDKFSDAAGNLNTDGAEANNIVSLATNATVTGALTKTAPNDSGPLGDNITNDNTPSLNGKVPAGSTAKIIINGVEQPVQVDANGNWTYTVPNGLPDGTYTPQLIVTPQGSSTPNAPVPLTPFTIDTVPPSIVVSAPTNSLVAGQTTPITFTLSEPVADFTATDIAVTGGTLSNFVQSPTDPKIYTATFTPSTTGTSASITVPSGKFSDAAANFNTDGADTAPATTNTITLATNATASGGLAPVSDNSTGTPNDNTTNDATPELAGKVPVGSTAVIKIKDANGNVVGEGPATINPDGTWSFTQPNNLPDGTYSPEAIVNGGTPTPLKQFVIDTTPPAVAITAPVTTLAAGASTVVTFTVSEGTTDLTLADIAVTGGTLGTLQQSATNPLVYTATYTSTSGGAGAVSIASNKFSDAAGNLNKDTNENPAATGATYEANNTVGFNTGVNPTPDAATGKLAPTSDSGVMGDNKTNDTTPELKGTVPPGSTAVIKIKDDKGNVVGEGPATVNPDGTWSFTQPNNLPDGVYTPEVIVNGGTPTPITPFVIDTTPPTIFIQADKTQLLAGQTTTVTFTLSEAVTDFAWNATTQTGDITVSGGTLGALTHVGVNSSGEDVYTAVFTPTAGSTATSVISVGSGKFSDAANNFNTDGDEVNNTLMLPTNTVTGGGTGFLAPNSDSGTPGDNVTNDDTPTITGKVPPGSTASVNINGKDYPVTVNPDGSYSYTIPDGLPDGTYTPKIKVTPPGGGTPVESDGTPFTIDTTPPTVLVTSDKTSLSTGQTATITFTLSEDSSDFTLADVTATGGTLSNLVPVSGSGKVYTATFTPSANSTTISTVKVDSLKFSDAAGNFNVDGADTGVTNTNIVSMTTNTTVADTTLPTIAISADRSSLATGQTTLVTFTLSEASSNFVHGDISVTGGTLGTLTQSPSDPKVYTAVFTPNANSTTTSVISVASNKFTDAAGNNNQDGADANNTVSLPTNTTPGLVTGALDPKSDTGTPGDNKTLDNTPTISGTAPPGSEVEIRIPGQNGQPDTVVKGKADENGQYSINVPNALPDGDYTPEIRVTPPGGPTSSTDGTPFTIDTTAPTILVASDKTSLSAGQTATITFTLSEASTDFTLADIQVTGGTLSNLTGSGTSYTATFTPTAGSTTTSVIHVASDKFSDAAGNFNADGADTDSTNTNIVRIAANTPAGDTTPPTILVERTNTGATTLDANSTETILFTLSEASTTFGADDIDTRGGTLSGFTPVASSGTAATGYTKYTAVFTPAANSSGTATIGVASGRFTDNAGNANKDTYVNPAPTGAETQLDTNNTNQVSLGYDTRSTNPVDTDKPTIQVSIDKTSLAAGQTATLTFILSEASTEFTLEDIDVFAGNGTVSNLQAVPGSNGTQYTATYTAGSIGGTDKIGVDAGKFADATGNRNTDTYKGSASGTSASAVSGATSEANNWVQLTNTGTTDTTPPTVAVSRMGSGTVGSAGETIVFTFSEGVPASSFVVGDIDAVGGNMSNLVPVETSKTATGVYTQYTATFVPDSGTNGTATIGVRAGRFTDAATTPNANVDDYTLTGGANNNAENANNQVTLGYDARTNPAPTDTTAPTIAISAAKTTLNAGETTVVTFTLSEPSTDFLFSENDIATTGGTLSNFQVVAGSGNTQYTATFTPTGGSQGTGSVHVDSNAFRDAANNYNADGAEANNTVNFITNNGIHSDTTPPTIEVLRLGSGTLTSNETIQFTLSEASKDFTLDDIVVLDASGTPVTGTLSNFAAVPTSGTAGTGYTTYVATLTAPANASGSLKVAVASSKFSDAAGNLNQDTYVSGDAHYEANNHQTISYNTLSPSTDTTPPTVIVGRDGTGNLASGQTDTITFTLSEASLTFDLSDVTVKDAQGNVIANALTNFAPVAASGTATGGYTVYTATFTPPSGSGTATIGVESDKFTDLAGNKNKDTYLTGVANTSYEANNKVDIGYNTATPSTDTTPPTVEVLRSGTGTMTGPETIYFNFSEPVATSSFTTADITYTGGQISNLVGVESSKTATGVYTQYIATFTPTAGSEGTATIGVKAGTFADAAGNNNKDTFESGVANTVQEDNNIVSASYDTNPAADTTPPTVAISRVGTTAVTATDTIVFVFSEPVSNFDLTDVVNTANGQPLDAATQGALSNLVGVGTPDANGRYTQYKATYTAPTGTGTGTGSVGTVTLGIKAGTFNDAASNTNKDTYSDTADTVTGHVVEGNNQLTLGWNTDTTPPTIGITRSGSGTLTSGTETITFTLIEASSDFAQSMVEVDGGTLSNWTQTSATTYTATFTPNSNSSGTATIKVDSSKFHDLAGNANLDTYRTGQGTNSQPADGSATANQVDIAYNTQGATFSVQNDTASIGEAGGVGNATAGSALASTTSGVASLNVLSNDNTATTVTQIALSGGSNTAVTSGSTSASNGTSVTGQYGTLVMGADGSYTYTLTNSNATVNALQTGSSLSEVFTYTASDGATQSGSANLVITITGTNDAPVAVADTATAVEKGGVSNAIAGIDPSGNVLSNDTDVDTGDTRTVSAILAGTTGTATTVTATSASASTGTTVTGAHGTLHIGTDGSYTYVVNQNDTAVQALLPTSTALTDTFTYTVKDAAGLTDNTKTLVVSITGANDAPTVTTAIADKTGTVGTALTPINVTSNFADVDTVANGETATYSAKLVDSAGNLVNGGNLPSWLQLDAATGIFTGTPPAGTAAGDIYIRAIRTDKGGLSASDDFKITLAAAADVTPPTVAITSNQASLSSGQTALITFTFSEAVTGFVWDPANPTASTNSIVVEGGTLSALSNPTTINGQTVYTATFTPTANSQVDGVVKIAAGKFTDTATTPNANVDTYDNTSANYEANNKVTLTVNTTVASSLTLINDTATPAVEAGVENGNTAVAGTNPSGNVMSNDTAATSVTQIALSGGSNTAVTSGSTSASNGTSVTGQYGTLVMGANGSYTYTVDNSNATVNALQVGGSLTEVFTYTATDGTTSKTANLSVTINGTNDAPTVVLPELLADQTGTTGTLLSYTFDSGTFADVDTGDSKNYTATFADNTALSTTGWLTFDPTTRTFTGTPTAAGTYSVKVICEDSQHATAEDVFDIVVTSATDTTSPTVAVTRSGSGDMTGNETITFTLSEASSDFAFEDVTVTGDGSLDSASWTAVSSTVYTAIFIPTANKVGTASVGVKAGTFTDAANNANQDTYEPFISGTVMEENNLRTMNVKTDVTPPTIAISQVTSPVTGATTVTFTLSEASTDFTAGGVYVTPGAGSLSNWTADASSGNATTGYKVYTATFTPTANSSGSVTIGVHANAFKDAAGLFNQDDYILTGAENVNNKTDFTYNTDVTPPTVEISRTGTGAVNGPVTITFTLSEVSADFLLSQNDITVSGGGTLSNFQQSASNPLVYTATYTPPATSTGAATINIASGTFHDPANNANADGGEVNNHLPLSYDTVTPTVEVTRATSNTLGGTGAPYTTELITFTLSEASSDFTWNDSTQTGSITVSGGTLGALTHVGVNSSGQDVYTATFTPATGAAGTGYIGVQAGKFHDAAGNANADTYLSGQGQGSNTQAEGTAGANQVSVNYDTQAPTQTVSFGSMTKDSGLTSGNANWTTADASAGRLVSGFLSAPLNFGETVQIWAKTGSGAAVLLGTATVNAAGTAWEFTDTTNYVGATGATGNTAGWTYTGKVVDAAGNAGTPTDQVVNGDYTEAAPVITSVTDSTSASIADNGTTANTLGTISGTGVAGNTVYVYDNTGTNLVGSAVVQAGGTWTITGLNTNTAVGTGSNTFAAKQVDPLGNESVLSNLWTVTTTASTNLVTNGDFASGNTSFATDLTISSSAAYADQASYWLTAGGAGYVSNSFAAHSSTLVTSQTAKTGTVATTANTSNISWSSDWDARAASTTLHANPDGTITGDAYWGGVVDTVATKIWGQTMNVVAGQSYTLKFDYMDGFAKLQLVLDGAAINFTSKDTASFEEAGHFTATFTATTTGTIDLNINAFGRGAADGGADGNFVLDNISFVKNAAPPDNSLVAGSTPPATPNPDNLTYTAGALDAEGSDDIITVSSTALQATLAAGGFIDGGAGIDTLKLAAGTTLNLEALTANQTVQKIQEVEIFKMQGASTLQMSANDVLSLGGANASTMAPFTFASTQQVNDGSTTPTGSTSSEGKVQMVVQGTNTDTLKLDTLASDGTTNAGVSGNAGLSGVWEYKGTVQVGLTTYKVYDHSTTNAQVLVDVPVVVNTISPIEITAITNDTYSNGNLFPGGNDFVTSDNTLVYSGTVPVEFVDASHDVFVEILNSSGAVVRSGTATVTGTAWSWSDVGNTLADGNYTIRSTIVNQGTTTATTAFGAMGVDTQPLKIDTTLPTIVVTRATSNTLSAGQTETITFTLSEASTDFTSADVDVTGGEIINLSGSGTTYTATYVPASGSGTGTIKVDSTKFSDLAGNFNADGADPNNTVSVDYQALPTQTATFSSMTKDSGLAASSTNNHDWLTNDGSAGRLVSGTLDAPLTSGQTLKVYANGVLIGNAVVNGQAWEITDLTGYTANWTYTAKVVDSAGNAGPVATQVVNTDFTEAPPVITSVTDSANTSIGNNGTTTNTLSTVSGTGNAGDTVYLYDNTGTNLVGTTTVASNGTWSISIASSTGVGYGSNAFSAKQVDALGNISGLSNVWTVTSNNELVTNGTFSNGTTAWTTAATGTGSIAPVVTSGGLFFNGGDTAPGGTASQVINTTVGKAYTLSLTAGEINSGVGNHTLTIELLDASGIVISTLTQVINNNTTAQSISLDFVATSATTTLRIANPTSTSTITTDLLVDNVSVKAQATIAADGSLVAGGTAPFTAGVDGVSTTRTYTAGAADMLAGDDVLNIGTNAQTLLSTSGNVISGGACVDTLKLAAGTVLNLETLTTNQTVKPIEQVEVFTLQGSSALTLSANDVLSLGGANASTMSAYSFASTTGGTASTASTGKVQMVVHGTSSDTLVLDPLKTDGVTTNSIVGNTGLAGQWDYMGTTTANGATYKVYNQSTTGAQVLVDQAVNVIIDDPVTVTNVATFSSMTKDSSMATATADWLTNDASAGRLVSGTLASALAAGDVVKVYANGTLIGNATVNSAGTAWEITDTSGYSNNWVYTAQVVNSAGKGGAATVQQVNLDNTEAAPTITAVIDATSTNIADNGSTYYALSTVSGTGNAGDTVYLYDNTGTNLVGTTTVASNGTWSISGLASNAALGSGSNAFSARQVDALGNSSVLSNVWTVNTNTSGNLLDNGDLSLGNTGFTATETYSPGVTATQLFSSNGASYTLFTASDTQADVTLSTTSVSYTSSAGNASGAMTYQINYNTGVTGEVSNPGGKFSGQYFGFNSQSTAYGAFWADTINVVAGQTYNFSLDYINWNHNVRLYVGDSYVDMWGNSAGTGSTAAGSVLYAHGWGTFTAATTGTLSVELRNINGATDFQFDNLYIGQASTPSNGSLVAGGTPPFTSGVDGASTAITYTGGAADMLAGDDVLNIGTNAQTLLATSGNFINGAGGIDTLKLAAGTTLNLVTLTNNQTVKSIEQVEIFELQGSSTLTLSANDVLSLGQTNAFGTASTKVQLMIKGTSTDQVSLQNLLSDGVGGNTGLAGMWTKESSTVTVSGTGAGTYNVYTHSTTGAQVLISTAVPDASVTLATSPLVLDLNGNGIETTTLAAGAVFDLDANGTAERAAWVAGGDGLLVRDLDGNGLITSGAELFGSGTTLANGAKALDGFAALAGLDSNGDGIINASDAAFGQLQVWVDANGDAHTDAGELRSLADLGIASLDLHSQASDLQNNGNAVGLLGSYTTTDGAEHVLADVWLQNQSLPVLDLTQVLSDAQTATANLSNGQAELLRLNVSDVLAVQANANGQHVVQITGDAQDLVDLSDLFADGHTTGTWAQNGTVQQNGQTFNVYSYSGDASLQVLIDQHIAQGNVHLG